MTASRSQSGSGPSLPVRVRQSSCAGAGPMPSRTPGSRVIESVPAGGLAEWANEENIIILRREGNKEKKLRFNYKRVIQGEDLEQNIFIWPDDTIVVP